MNAEQISFKLYKICLWKSNLWKTWNANRGSTAVNDHEFSVFIKVYFSRSSTAKIASNYLKAFGVNECSKILFSLFTLSLYKIACCTWRGVYRWRHYDIDSTKASWGGSQLTSTFHPTSHHLSKTDLTMFYIVRSSLVCKPPISISIAHCDLKRGILYQNGILKDKLQNQKVRMIKDRLD